MVTLRVIESLLRFGEEGKIPAVVSIPFRQHITGALMALSKLRWSILGNGCADPPRKSNYSIAKKLLRRAAGTLDPGATSISKMVEARAGGPSIRKRRGHPAQEIEGWCVNRGSCYARIWLRTADIRYPTLRVVVLQAAENKGWVTGPETAQEFRTRLFLK
jgi:hypothetical protein